MVGTRLHEMALHVAHNHFPALECLKKVKHVSRFESCQPPPTNKEQENGKRNGIDLSGAYHVLDEVAKKLNIESPGRSDSVEEEPPEEL